jgi:hypothetical protein
MYDLEIHLQDRPGQLATLGEALAGAGVSVEGGGVWAVAGVAVAHFLVENGPDATRAISGAGLEVRATRPVLLVRLDQEQPGQLGKLARVMSDAGVNIDVQYSDHHGQLVLLVDDPDAGRDVMERWMSQRTNS